GKMRGRHLFRVPGHTYHACLFGRQSACRVTARRFASGHRIMQVSKSNKLANVCYDIRGPVLKHAKRLEEEGHRILKLNIGNPAPFGFEAPEEILQDVIRNLPTAQGYCDSKGLFSARKAVMQYYQQKQVEGVG